MNKFKKLKEYLPIYVKGWIIYLGSMLFAVFLCTLLHPYGSDDRHVPLIFVLVSLLVSLLTEGYFYGVLSAFTGVITANYIFTFPYIELDFSLSGYPLTFFTMLAVSVVVCALTTRLKQQEKLKSEAEKERMRANLLRAISHDLRSPLTGISGAISAVLEGNCSNDEQAKDLLQGAKEDADWLYSMVENLLSITRIVNDRVNGITKREEMLEEIFSDAVVKFRRYHPEVALSVSVPDELMFVPMDGVLIQQVITNILDNAVLHGETTDKIWIKARTDGEFLRISIADNGKGIPKDALEHLFDSNYKFSKETRIDKSRSLGIGLSVCKTIVESHGGKIGAYNTETGGACFEFTLPLEDNGNEY